MSSKNNLSYNLFSKVIKFRDEHKMNDFNLLDVIMSYAEENELDLIEIAEEIKNDINFKEYLKSDLIENNYIKEDDKIENEESIINDWV